MSAQTTVPCIVCDEPASLRCSKCKGVNYCGREHQVSDWKRHKTVCGSLASTANNNELKESGNDGKTDTSETTTVTPKPTITTITPTLSLPTKTRQCAYCYADGIGYKSCGGCHKRYYCSREHQKLDWKKGHSKWCCKSGEIDFDFEIRESKGKGLGFFALRDLKRNEKIMVER